MCSENKKILRTGDGMRGLKEGIPASDELIEGLCFLICVKVT